MKVSLGWQIWGWLTLVASLSVHGFLLSLPISLDLEAPEPEPIAAIPLTTLPEIPSPPPEPLASDRDESPKSEVMSAAEVYEPATFPQPEVIQAVEVYEPEVFPQSEVDIESESFDRTLSSSRDRRPQLPVQPTAELEELRQQKIKSMKEQAAQSSESPLPDPNPENTPLNLVSEMFAQMDTDLDRFLSENLQSDDRKSFKTNEDIIELLATLSLNLSSDDDQFTVPDHILKTFLLDDFGNFKEGIISEKLRLITFLPDVDMTAEKLYQDAIEPTIDSEKYQISTLHDVQKDINEDRIYEIEKKTTPKLPEDRKFYIQLIMIESTIIYRKVAAIIVWDRQPEPLFTD